MSLSFVAFGLVSAAVLVPATAAVASTSSDLSVTQSVSTTGAAGEVSFTVTIHNAGPDAATGVLFNAQVKTTSSVLNIAASGSASTCFLTGTAPGYKGQYICEFSATLNSLGTVTETISLTGTTGKPVSQLVTVGNSGSSDPNFANNTNTIKSYFGPAADKAVTNSVSSGGAAGTRKITTTVTNKGPSAATNLVTDIDINAPGLTRAAIVASGPATSCFFIATHAGFSDSIECDSGPLAPGAKLKLVGTYGGTSGSSLVLVASATSTEVDPVSTNNSATSTTTFK